MAGTWLMTWQQRPTGRPVLLCVPPAGAGCAQFRTWQEELGNSISVVGVQLPGRENRWLEPYPRSVEEVVDAVVGELSELLRPGHPMVVFGHSFGALLGYEITKALVHRDVTTPQALVVAACRPPEHWEGSGRRLADDGDEDLEKLLNARGLDPDDLDVDTRELLLHALRKDARLSASYDPRGRREVDCLLEAWGGEKDETVLPQHVADWSPYAAGKFRRRLFPGGHYFCLKDHASALALLGPMTSLALATEGTVR